MDTHCAEDSDGLFGVSGVEVVVLGLRRATPPMQGVNAFAEIGLITSKGLGPASTQDWETARLVSWWVQNADNPGTRSMSKKWDFSSERTCDTSAMRIANAFG
jgi:hypothetical protein